MLVDIDSLITKLEVRSHNANRDPYTNTPEVDCAVSDSLSILANIFKELKEESLNEEKPI